MKNTKYSRSCLPLLLVWLLAGCSLPLAGGPGPHAWIDTPVEGLVLPLAPVIVRSHASDLAGVAQFELHVDGAVVRTDLSVDHTAGALVSISQTWVPTRFGEYTLEVVAVNTAGAKGHSLPVTVVIGTAPGLISPPAPYILTVTPPEDARPVCRLDQLVAPAQLAPADGADVTSPVHFEWSYPESDCHPSSFAVRISEPGSAVIPDAGIGWGFITYDDHYTSHDWALPAGGCYYWQALAYVLDAYGPPSPVHSFCMQATPMPPTATLTPTIPLAPTSSATLKPTDTPKPTFVISGVAWNDGNGNGLREVSEAGMPDVGIELLQGTCSGKVLTSLTTGKNGSYKFNGLAAGSYCVRVSNPPKGSWTATTPIEAMISIGPNGEVNFGYIFFG